MSVRGRTKRRVARLRHRDLREAEVDRRAAEFGVDAGECQYIARVYPSLTPHEVAAFQANLERRARLAARNVVSS